MRSGVLLRDSGVSTGQSDPRQDMLPPQAAKDELGKWVSSKLTNHHLTTALVYRARTRVVTFATLVALHCQYRIRGFVRSTYVR